MGGKKGIDGEKVRDREIDDEKGREGGWTERERDGERETGERRR